MKKILLFFFLLMSIGVYSATVTLSQSDIKNTTPSDGTTGYASYTISSGGYSWSAYAIKNKHSNVTSDKHYLQIKKYEKSTAYYVSIPTMPGNITSILVTVSNANQPMTGGGNTATLYFSNSNSTSSTGTGVISGTGASSITLDCASLKLKTGYITASAGIRIWELVVTYSETSTPTTYTVSYDANGGSVTPESYTQLTEGEDITLPTPTRDGYTFTGWYTASADGDKIGNAGDNYVPSSNTTLYAHWEEIVVVNGETFELLSDINDLESGNEIIILNTDGTCALSTTQNNNNRGSVSNSNSFTLNNNVVTLTNNDVQIITIGGSVGAWTFDVGDGYLYAASSSKNYLRTQTSNDANGEWNITISSNNATITAQGLNTHNILRYNSSDNIFSCYSSGQQPVQIYKKQTCLPTISVTKIEQGGTFNLSSDSVCENGSVTLSNITPSVGYKFDTIICIAQDGKEFIEHGTVNISNSTISGITKDCYVVVIFSQLPPKPEIDIVEWNPDYIKVGIDNFDAVSAVIENKNTQEAHIDNVATELFFSKYFEAESTIKLLGIYNGTKDSINLENYEIKIAQGSKQTSWNKSYPLNRLEWIHSGEEIILYSYDINANNIVECINSYSTTGGFEKYIRVQSGGLVPDILQFNGDDAIGLFKSETLIDIIGAGNSSSANISGLSMTGADNNSPKDTLGHIIDMDCWITDKADNSNGYSSVIGTNLCLLIRKSTVHSGDSAVKYNVTDFVTLADEWIGKVVSKKDSSTCKNFDYVGSFDYNEHYAQYTQVGEDITLASKLQPDGSYKISIPYLDTLSCTLLKVIVNDNSDKTEEREYKIPIFVTENTESNSTLFSQEGADCPECDVVIIKGGKLTVNSELTNRDVTVYPGGVLVIPDGQTYNVNSLTLRRDNDSVPYFLYKGTLNTNKFNIDLRTDANDWRWMTLPFAIHTDSIKLSNGKPINLNNNVWISYYDGKHRSIYQRNAWKDIYKDTVFNAGEGFLFGVDLPGQSKKIYRFSFNKDSIKHEKSDKIIRNLYAWGGNNENLAPNHKGWNLIGNPFMDSDTTNIINPIRIGRLKKDSVNGQWTGGWIVDSITTKLRYAVIPNKDEEFADAGYYESVVLDDYVLQPLTSFFVQIGGNDSVMQQLTFESEKRTNRIVARRTPINERDEELFLRIKIGDKKTGCFISNHFNENYEPGDDLESRYAYYQLINGYKLLYSAINDSIIENGIQIHSIGGKVALDPKVETEKFEQIYILYNNEWYDLLHGDEPEVSGDFILYGKRKINEDIPTDIGNIKPGQGTYKFIHENNIFINNKGKIYNVLGSSVK